jgi:hypothetical protein
MAVVARRRPVWARDAADIAGGAGGSMITAKKAAVLVAAALLLSACVGSSDSSDASLDVDAKRPSECAHQFGGDAPSAEGLTRDGLSGQRACF